MVNDEILSKAQDSTKRNQYVGERLIPQIVVLLTDGKSNDQDPTVLQREVSRLKNDIQGMVYTHPNPQPPTPHTHTNRMGSSAAGIKHFCTTRKFFSQG